MYGDSYLPCDYSAVARKFKSASALGMMTIFRNEGKWDTSNVEFDAGRILAYSKTTVLRACVISIMDWEYFAPKPFKIVSAGQAHDLAEVYADLLQRNQLAAFEVHERFYEIGSPAGLREMAEFLAAQELNRES